MHSKKFVRISNSFSSDIRLCGLVIFIKMNTYILTEGRDFRAFLKDNYAITLNNCYLFTKKMLNMMLIVLIEYTL